MDERFGAEQDLVIGMSEVASESAIQCPAVSIAGTPVEAIG